MARVKGNSEFYLDNEGRPIPLSPTHDSEVPTIVNDPDVDRYEALSALSVAIAQDVFWHRILEHPRPQRRSVYACD